jgi:NAD(P)-dependent dehydrogenase (short-subunit alcohol dehydrogenase family)
MRLATARAFAAHGASVTLADIDEDALRAATDQLAAAGRRALGVVCDVSDEDQVAALVDRTVGTFGRLASASTPSAPERSTRPWSPKCSPKASST